MIHTPQLTVQRAADAVRLSLSGHWTSDAEGLEGSGLALITEAGSVKHVLIDLAGVERLDTAGAWVIGRSRAKLREAGRLAEFARARPEFQTLLEAAHFRVFPVEHKRNLHPVVHFLEEIGAGVAGAGRDLVGAVAFLGEVIAGFGRLIIHPARIRPKSIVTHIENFAFRSVPIIALINFLVGCIVAQQGIFQLRRFGAATFAVDLIGILVLRELAVLLTSIMVAGRTGSAITAEIGSMKMREEIDALRVMGLDPIEVLIVPRIIALIIALPLLTFIADMASVFGGLLVAWVYEGISPQVYLGRLQSAIALHTFLVGLIKAPFMALVIGLIASVEGFAVEGSAESLGRRVTDSVVKSIFMVIVVDGLFAMFFAAVDY